METCRNFTSLGKRNMKYLPVIFRVQADHQDSDMSRFRTAMMMNTLVPSLKNQKDQIFKVAITQNPEDKMCEKREQAFGRFLIEPQIPITFPRVEVEVPDDDFLGPEFVAKLKLVPQGTENCFIAVPNGYCLNAGKLRLFRNQPERLAISMILHPDQPVRATVDGPQDPHWIHVRHHYSDVLETPEMKRGATISSLNWAGWKQELVVKYADVQLKSATSAGVTVQFPRRVVYAGKRQKSKRGKRS
jgi:hypothetical protein